MFTSIIFIHELGHFFVAKLLKWHVDKIYFYPYGGFTKFNDHLNKPKYQEILIMLAGPFVQIFYFYLIINMNILSNNEIMLFSNYHYSILLFNLLPIYPLDGGKLLNIIFNYFFSFRKSFKIVITFSYGIIFLIILIFLLNRINFSLSILLTIMLVICKLTQEAKKSKFYFNKFLLERYLNDYNFHKVKVIKGIRDVSRDYKHVVFSGKKYKTEKEELSSYFGDNL